MARQRGSSYWHYNVVCPFYDYDTADRIGCEGGIALSLPNKPDIKAFLKANCCDMKRWEQCPVAKMINAKYQEEVKNERKK